MEMNLYNFYVFPKSDMMEEKRTLLFIGVIKNEKRFIYFGHAPMEGAGSAIIILRHLQRLAANGWKNFNGIRLGPIC